MTEEDKRLLLKDLCSRIPFGVKVRRILHTTDTDTVESVEIFNSSWLSEFYKDNVEFKPYLRPLSDMTEEEEKELRKDYNYHIYGDQIRLYYHSEGYWDTDNDTYSNDYLDLFEWLMDHHFDFRGLIKKGLALVAEKEMYY